MTPEDLADASHRQAGVTWIAPPAGTQAEVAAILAAYFEKVATIPWLPKDWRTRVERLKVSAPGDQAVKIYGPYVGGSKGSGQIKAYIPEFLDSPAKREKWQAVADEQARILAFIYKREFQAAKQAADESASRVEFWNDVYNVTEAVRDLPATAVNAVANGAASAIGGNLGKLFTNPATVLFLAAGAAFVWWRYLRPRHE